MAAPCQAPHPAGCSSLSWQPWALLCPVNMLGRIPWSSAGRLSWAAFLLFLLLPSHASAVQLPLAALAQSAPARRHLAKPWQIPPGSSYAMGHSHDVLLSWSPPSPGSKRHQRSHRYPRWWQRWWRTGTAPGPHWVAGSFPGALGCSACIIVVPGVVRTLPAAAWPLAHGLLLQSCGHGQGRWKEIPFPLKCLREFRG